jgi:hypothetical protein
VSACDDESQDAVPLKKIPPDIRHVFDIYTLSETSTSLFVDGLESILPVDLSASISLGK